MSESEVSESTRVSVDMSEDADWSCVVVGTLELADTVADELEPTDVALVETMLGATEGDSVAWL